jgi:hypothetical protein
MCVIDSTSDVCVMMVMSALAVFQELSGRFCLSIISWNQWPFIWACAGVQWVTFGHQKPNSTLRACSHRTFSEYAPYEKHEVWLHTQRTLITSLSLPADHISPCLSSPPPASLSRKTPNPIIKEVHLNLALLCPHLVALWQNSSVNFFLAGAGILHDGQTVQVWRHYLLLLPDSQILFMGCLRDLYNIPSNSCFIDCCHFSKGKVNSNTLCPNNHIH